MAKLADRPEAVTVATAPARLPVAWAAALAFAASAATLVLELVAGRMLAPYVGVSLYTWTSIIGVILAGISLGNFLGGRLADRRASARTLGALFLLGGLAVALTLGLIAGLGPLSRGLPLLARIFALSAVVFVPPSLLLAMVTPTVIRLTLPDVRHTGRVVGLVYAVGTAGSLLGNFATGFVLTAYFEVTTIVLAVAALMLALGLASALASAPDGGTRGRGDSGSAPFASPLPPGEGQGEGALDGRGAWQPLPGRGPVPALEVPVAEDGTGVSASPRPRVPASRFLSLEGNARLAGAVVVVASFASMGIELAASRLLAPYLGLSLYSWTGIIGVVLLAITLGNYLGGWIADRWPSQRTLGLSLFVGGLGALAILLLAELLDAYALWSGLGLIERILLQTAVVFFVPILLLGTISPQVTRLAVTDLGRSGRIAGEIYAWSTAGAILGTFATGWYLVSALGVHALIFALGLVLIALALLVGRFWQRRAVFSGLALLALFAVVALQQGGSLRSRCTEETNYFCIKVGDETKPVGPVKTLVLDHLVHSYVKLDDPTYLGYVHEQVQAELTDYLTQGRPDPRVLVIGGGGYTYPRWVEARLPRVGVEVVEIDPGVTRVAHDYLGLPRTTRIASHNLDGRQFVQELAPRGTYRLVVQDAVNDLSVPYHIMTREYDDRVRALLQPDGAYLLTVIDLFRDGQLLRAAIRTMQASFPRVQLLAAGPAWQSGGANVWVIAGSAEGVDVGRLRAELGGRGWTGVLTTEMPPDQLAEYVSTEPRIVLSDEYAPVDNLIAILFRSRG
jgi:spermidine synthase/MFS family permease